MRMFAALLGLFVSVFAIAEDKKPATPALSGSYTHSAGDLDVILKFKKDGKLDYVVKTGDAGATLECKYTKEKDGTVKCEVENFVKKGDFPVTKEKGYKFSFKIEVKKSSVVLSDLNGDEIDEQAKKALEGEYTAVTE